MRPVSDYYVAISCFASHPRLLTACLRCSILAFRKKEVTRVEAYCVKCRAKREIKDAKSITMKNGRPATQGVCPVCGTKMFRIGKS